MTVGQLMRLLEMNSDRALHFVLPSGDAVPLHFHVTEVGRIDKSFIDCGGTRRRNSACSLQLWSAEDLDHRLAAGKLSKILSLAEPILESRELPVEVEYGPDHAVQYRIADFDFIPGGVRFILSGKQTDCLAREQCGVGECGATGCCR